jgi:chromosome segregation protein
MVLRKLSIFGFKSFADKTEIEFGEGITALIGPNGSGKSNVIDAIRWVFGEQKPTALRSTNMQDVIFSGSQKRAALNFAEVTLTIENTKRILPIDYSEVSITRKIYRNGESEYFINKTPCRLRDIYTMFLDTGIGTSAYTTIENSMINAILSDKAEERRILFEEAAGIGKYKERRKESLRQLERTKQDLIRLNDKIQEADRQVRMLARHVEKANKYKKYFEELKAIEVGYEKKRYDAYTSTLIARKSEIEEKDKIRQIKKGEVSSLEADVEKAKLESLEQEKVCETALRRVAENNEAIVSLDRDISVAKERITNLKNNLLKYEQEIISLDEQINDASNLKTKMEKSHLDHTSELNTYIEKVDNIKKELALINEKVEKLQQEAEIAANNQIEIINKINEHKNNLTSLNTDYSNSITRRDQIQKQLESLQIRQNEYKEALEISKRTLETANEFNKNLSVSRESLLERIDKEEQKFQSLVEAEKKLEAQIDSCKSQRAFLEGLDSSYEGYESGVKTILSQKLPGIIGIAADFVRVSDETVLEIVERVLGQSIQTVIFKTDAELKNAISFLTAEKKGTAKLLSLERLTRRAHVNKDSTVNVKAEPLRKFINVAPEYENIADYLFKDIYITNNLEEALESTNGCGNAIFASRDGIICQENGYVVAGNPQKQQIGILARRQKIEKCNSDLEKFEKEYQKVIHEKEICIINRDEAKYALIEVDEKLNSNMRQQQEQQTNIRHYENEIKNLDASILSLKTEYNQLNERIHSLDANIKILNQKCIELEEEKKGIENRVEITRLALTEVIEQRTQTAEHLKNLELEMMGLSSRLNQEKQDIERLMQSIIQGNSKKNKLQLEISKTKEEIEQVENLIKEKEEELSQKLLTRTELEQIKNNERDKHNIILIEIEDNRNKIKLIESEIENLSNIIHNLELEQTRDEQEQRRIRERIFESYKIDLESPQENISYLDREDSQVLEDINIYKERLKRLGDVNMASLTDYETENARLHEMTTQRDDLQKAVDELEKAIKKLDKEARTQFLTTFEQVKVNFVKMFTTLFEGGEAALSLEENVDPLEASININVRPAGKKMRNINLLSGGERALTAISLLFSLYMVKPSAYCILDELDAPLDDANIERFLNILKTFSSKTQFIVVTHNKRTMEVADIIYGVTQQEKGVSTMLSVKFEDAAVQAA